MPYRAMPSRVPVELWRFSQLSTEATSAFGSRGFRFIGGASTGKTPNA
jgi:hypothetical protein